MKKQDFSLSSLILNTNQQSIKPKKIFSRKGAKRRTKNDKIFCALVFTLKMIFLLSAVKIATNSRETTETPLPTTEKSLQVDVTLPPLWRGTRPADSPTHANRL